MKSILLALATFILIPYGSIAQDEIPIEELESYWLDDGYPANTEFRDVNDLFHPFIGTWEGSYAPEGFTLPVFF